MIHPTPWRVYRFGYERYAMLDANQAEVAEFVRYEDAALCVELVNERPRGMARLALAGFLLGIVCTSLFVAAVVGLR
jgi:hypothetical protein